MSPEKTSTRSTSTRDKTPQEEAYGATPAQNSHRAPRSCYRCNQRKVRCDKKYPCSPCRKTGGSCEYPPSGPRTRRSKKTIMAEMAARISDLESRSTSNALEPSPRHASRPSVDLTSPSTCRSKPPVRHPESVRDKPREDVLLQSGSSSQYFNEIFLSRVIKNERNIGSILASPQPASPQPWASSPFSIAGILSSPEPSIQPASLHPPRHIAVRLWHIYLSNAAPCTGFELLHQPTDELKVYSTIDNPAMASYEDLALSFAIYFTSVVSLDATEAQVVLGQDRASLLQRFKVGLQQTLAHGNFLDCPTIYSLYAFAIYLSVLRVQNRGKGLWIVKGLAIRVAQALGLHRDGTRFGLPPFECEIRRRVWWHLLSRDRREGEDHGLENSNSLILTSDVQLPRNLDDADLYPGMQELPEAKSGWTAVTFALVSTELARAMSRLAALVEASSPSSPPSEEARVAIVEETWGIVEKWRQGCNRLIPQQLLTYTCAGFLLRKLDFISKLQFTLARHIGRDAVPPVDFATEENLTVALEIMEPSAYCGDDLLRQFVWMTKAFPQYHVVTYVLWHLCLNPEGPSAESAWAAVDGIFSDETSDGAMIGLRPKLAVLSALRAKALSVRAKARGVDGDHGRDEVGSEKVHAEDPPVPEFPSEPLYDGLNVDGFIDGEWPTWTTLAQGFQLDGPGLFSL